MSRARDIADIQDNAGGAVAPFVAGKNKIINGDFGVWQRGTSFSVTSAVTYAADRFSAYMDGSGTQTVSRQAFAPGTAPVAGYESQYFYRYAKTVAGTGQTYSVIAEQKIEDVRTFAGQTVTISFWAKADATRILNATLMQYFNGSANVYTGFAVNFSLTTSWARYSATITVPSIAGKTINANNYLAVYLSEVSLNTVQTVDIWGVQLEAGSVATPFTTATGTIQGELAACQRYYEKSYDISTAPATATAVGSIYSEQTSDGAANALANVRFKQEKRTNAYSVAVWTTAGTVTKWQYARSGVAATDVVMASFNQGTSGLGIYANVGANWTANTIQGHWVVDNEL